jgi:hypothetical protein
LNDANPSCISLHDQQQQLLAVYPNSFCHVRGDELIWQGWRQPSDVGRDYLATIRYTLGETPTSLIVKPSLHEIVGRSSRPGRQLPHTYRLSGDPLCLFFGNNEWNPNLLLTETTVPWISLWLRFFELWLVTNTWEGSGAPYTE